MNKQKHTNHYLRRSFGALIAAALSLMMLPLPATAINADDGRVERSIPGDVNDDGEVTVIDLIILQGYLHGHDNVTILAPWNADINDDDEVDIFDLALAKRIVLYGAQSTEPIEPTNPQPSVTDGKLYQKIGLIDQYAGITAFDGVLPEGWTVQMQSNWNNINALPGQEIVTFVSPDGKASVTIESPQIYEQGSDRGYGADISNFIMLAPYMDASTFIQNYVQKTYPDAELIRNLEISDEQKKGIDEFTEYYATGGINTALQYCRYPITSYGAEGTIARQQFRLGNGYGEFCSAISAYQYTYTKVMLSVTETWWQTLNSVLYTAEDQASFEQYYDDYEIITTNGYFTAAFFSAEAYVQQQILKVIEQYRTEQRLKELVGDYTSSGTTITNSDMETQEKIFQAWDDYIKDEDTYTLGDGSTLRVPSSVDTIAQNGDSVYFGSKGGVPIGFDILTAN